MPLIRQNTVRNLNSSRSSKPSRTSRTSKPSRTSRTSRTSKASTISISRRSSRLTPSRSKSRSVEVEKISFEPVYVERGRGSTIHRVRTVSRSQYAKTARSQSRATRKTAGISKIGPSKVRSISPVRRSVVFVDE